VPRAQLRQTLGTPESGGHRGEPGFFTGLSLMRLGASPDARCAGRCDTGAVGPSEAILVVDDHDGFRAFARTMLEAAGFTVAEAANGAEATETARMVRPRLVLLDIQLPDFDGFEVARRLAGQEHRPVIVLTSTRDASDYGGQIAASPAAGFLPKDQLSGAALSGFLTENLS
jgi:CheY-like chemotaxis protein